MLLRRVIEHVKTQNWTAVGIDFVIVVVGVFIGVQVNELVADGVNRQREHAYLLALKNDFAIIQAELEQDAAEYAAVADAMTFLLDQSRMARPDATPDELNVAVAALILMEGTPIVSGTFDAITGSGDLEIIRSDKVKVALTAFFGRAEVIRLVALTHESQLVNIFQPYIIAHLDYPAMLDGTRGMTPPGAFAPERIEAALQTDAFRNVIAIKWDIAADLRNIILIALERAKDVTAALDEELQKR